MSRTPFSNENNIHVHYIWHTSFTISLKWTQHVRQGHIFSLKLYIIFCSRILSCYCRVIRKRVGTPVPRWRSPIIVFLVKVSDVFGAFCHKHTSLAIRHCCIINMITFQSINWRIIIDKRKHYTKPGYSCTGFCHKYNTLSKIHYT